MKKVTYFQIPFLLLLFFSSLLSAQTTWTGTTSSAWDEPTNWTAGVPDAADDVTIPNVTTNDPIISTAAVAKSVAVETNSSLVVAASGSLTINGFASNYVGGLNYTSALFNFGTVTNNGNIIIGATASAGQLGIWNNGTFNNTAGEIKVDNSTYYSIWNHSGTFTNSAALTIGGASASVGNSGIWNNGTFKNTAGEIKVDNSTYASIVNINTLTNSAAITIGGASASVGDYGIENNGFFDNNTGGEIKVDNSANAGILNEFTFTNLATINIGANAPVGPNGIENRATFNNTGGELNIDNSTSSGIYNNLGTFTNEATITIGANTGVGSYGIYNSGSFSNTDGELNIDNVTNTGIRNLSGTFTNSAAITIGATASVGNYGIQNFSTFDNNSSGEIKVDNSTNIGIYNDSGTFTNEAAITIGANDPVGSNGIFNIGTFYNQNGGDIRIDNSTFAGLHISINGTFTNEATITIGANASVGTHGIRNNATFKNKNDGDIHIDLSTDTGLLNTPNGTFTNEAGLTIGANASVGSTGIRNDGTFYNENGGDIHIDNSLLTGLYNAGDTFTNSAAITIGANASVGANALENRSTFKNLSGELKIDRFASSGIYNNGGTLTNEAAITIGADAASLGVYGIYNTSIFDNNPSGDIHIDRSTNTGLQNNSGTFTNKAAITIGANASAGAYGLSNSSTYNNLGGEIKIDDISGTGIVNGGNFTNRAEINIGAMKAMGVHGIYNGSNFTNGMDGEINIDDTGNNGIVNDNSNANFTNQGKINIGANKAIGTNGVNNSDSANFANEADGEINIDDAGGAGVSNYASIFTNHGKINIGANKSIGGYGVSNTSTSNFTNETGGEINIDRSASGGIFNNIGSFTNEAAITIGAIASVGSNGIENRATFNNQSCAEIYLFEKVENLGTMTNAGLFHINTANTSVPGNFTNNGIIEDIQGTFPTTNAGLVNNEIVIAPISGECAIDPALMVGGGGSFTVSPEWFKDLALTDKAGDYAPNTFTITDLTEGMHQLFFTVSGNGCDFDVSIEVDYDDVTGPVPNCLHPTVQLDASGNYSLTENDVFDGGTDLCGTVNFVSMTPTSVSCADVWINNPVAVTVTANDGNGNENTCTALVTVEDNIAPTITCAAVFNPYGTDAGVCTYTVTGWALDAVATNDNCTVVSVTNNFTATGTLQGAVFPKGTTTVVWTATDQSGHTGQCSYDVIVKDDEPQAIVDCGPDQTVLTSSVPGTCSGVLGDYRSGVQYTDNCPGGTIWQTPAPGSIVDGPHASTTTVTLSTVDCGGFVRSCTITVTLVDDTAPAINCSTDIVNPYQTDAGTCTYTVPGTALDPTSATDNCTAVVSNDFSNSATLQGAAFPPGTTTVVWTVSDDAGNMKDCSYQIEVTDNEAPVAICPTTIADVVLDANGTGTLPANIGDGSSTDNCAANESSPSANYTCADVGVQTVVLSVDDGNGNSDTETCSFNVVDNLDPGITCPANVTKQCDQSLSSIWTGVATASDNCTDVANISISESDATTPGSCTNEWIITRTWTADDGNGNTKSCDQIITVEDTTGPAITCPADMTVECDADHSPANTGSATAVDNCDTQPVAISSSDATTPGSCAKEWTITRTWTATDVCGNSTPCDQTITVEDTTAPAITCPADVTVECSGDNTSAAMGTATAADNCSAVGDITIGESDATTPGACANGSIITRTWTATDECGKSSSCDQVVTVEDATAPVITCPGDITVECDADHTSAATGTATATDNCSAVGDITIGESDATTPGSCANEWTITRSWTATDECGQASSCDQVITVEDTTGPTMSCGTLTVTPNAGGTYALSQTEIDGLGAGSTDNCGNVTFSASPNSFGCGDEGANTVTVTGTDDCGNSNSCDAAVTVEPYLTIVSCTATAESCAGAGDGSIVIMATALGGQVKYSVDGGANYSASGTFNNLTPGTYNIVVKVFGIAEICEKTDTKSIAAGMPQTTWYKDADGDSYSDGNTLTSCTQPTGYIANPLAGTDCNDDDPAINPGATETCDGLDNDCDGQLLPGEVDADGDGYMVCEDDCDDTDPDVNPGATEVCNGIDDDCDGEVDEGVGSGLTWTGNVTFTTQAEVDAWLACYSIIDGNLTIMGSGITDLSSLIGLEEVTGLVFIYANGSLASLDGLDNLATVGSGLSIYYNFALTDCCAIYDLLNNGGVTGAITIFFNASGCNSQSEILSGCAPPSFTGGGQQESAWDLNSVQDMSLFPNPTSGTFSVRIPENAGSGQLSVVDIHGREMMGQQTVEGQATYLFERGTLAPGIYMVVLKTSGKPVQVKRLVVE